MYELESDYFGFFYFYQFYFSFLYFFFYSFELVNFIKHNVVSNFFKKDIFSST
jgi:hypothetical protein